MTKRKIWIGAAVMAALLAGSATVALAADDWKTPAQTVSDVTGKTEAQALADRRAGQAYGAQAAEAGKLDEFQAERLAQYKLRLDAAVKAGTLTQAEADRLYDAMKARMDACDGNGAGRIGGAGRGAGRGAGLGMGRGSGAGCGLGACPFAGN